MIVMLFFASCSEQQVMEETLSSQKLTEQKSMTDVPQDTIMSLLYQARWGDGSAYLLSGWIRGEEGFLRNDYYGTHGRVAGSNQ